MIINICLIKNRIDLVDIYLFIKKFLYEYFMLSKYFVLALAPDSHMGVIEPMENKPDWISFWRVPLTNGTLNVFGPMPQGIGNNVPRARNAGNLP